MRSTGGRFPIIKVDQEKRLIYGIAIVPNQLDLDDEWMDAAEVEKVAHSFLLKESEYNLNHESSLRKQHLQTVESFIASENMQWQGQKVKKGSWCVVTKIHNDKLWDMVKAGEITGYSIGGRGKTIEGAVPK